MKEELDVIKEAVKNESGKLHELTEEELEQVSGGLAPDIESADRNSKGYIPLGA